MSRLIRQKQTDITGGGSGSLGTEVGNSELVFGSGSLGGNSVATSSAELKYDYENNSLYLTASFYVSHSDSDSKIDFTNANSISGSIFSGSFVGDGSGLTNLNFSLPAGILSSSAQIAGDISGSFGADSASLSTRITNNENDISTLNSAGLLSGSSQISSEISGAFTAASNSIANDINNLQTDSGSFSTRITQNENNISNLNSAGLLSSSAQIASEISGASDYKIGLVDAKANDLILDSGSFSVRVTQNESDISTLNSSGLLSGSSQIGSEISGAFDEASGSIATDINNLQTDSGSFSTRITQNEFDISTLNSSGLLSSSAQIASEISGAFNEASGGFSTRITSLESSPGGGSNWYDGGTYLTASKEVKITGSLNVSQGNIGLRDNSYFLQGTATNDSNVSLIGVNSNDIIEIGNQGYTNIIVDDTQITGSLTVSGSNTLRNIGPAEFTGSLNASGSAWNLTDVDVISGSIFSGSFVGDGTGITGITVDLSGTDVISGSSQIASDISGAFGEASGGFSTRITTLETIGIENASTASYVEYNNIANKPALISGSAQIASEISGAFNEASSSIAGDINTNYSNTVITASNVLNNDSIEFLKGGGGTFSVTVNNVQNSVSASHSLTASYVDATGSSYFSGSVIINGLTYPESDGDDGDVLTTDGNGILSFDNIKVQATVKNISSATLLKGTPVHATRSASPPAGNVSEVVPASASDATSMPATFILNEDIVSGAEGKAISIGFINGVNTSGFLEGDIVYVGTNGGYTNIKPTGSDLIQNLGVVTKVDATNGSGYILGAGRSNDVPNIAQGYAWIGNGDGVAIPVSTSSIQNVVSSSYSNYVEYSNVANKPTLVSGSSQIDITQTQNYSGVVDLSSAQTISGTKTFNDIIVNGTASFALIQSVTGSAKIIGDAFIVLNNDTPTERYAGVAVYDSGSAGVTASLQFDGQTNDWFYEYSDDGGATTDHGVVIFGPEYSGIGSPTYPTNNAIQKGSGNHHLADSNITDNGTTVTINSNTDINGTLNVTTLNAENGIISGSSQIASEISGAFDSASGSIATDINNIQSDILDLQADSGSLASRVTQNESDISTLNSAGLLSGSSQIASEISGAFAEASGGFSTRITQNESDISTLNSAGLISGSAQISTDISGAFSEASGGFSTRITQNESDISTLNSAGLLSSSAQIASEISGAFSSPFTSAGISGSFTEASNSIATDINNLQTDSGSFSTRITQNESDISTLNGAGLLSGSAQIASEISGAFVLPSSSFSTRVTQNESDISTLNSAGLISGSAQIASDISGAFSEASGGFSTRVTNLENAPGGGSNWYDGGTYLTSSKDIQITGSFVVTGETTFDAGVTGSSFTGSFVGDGSGLTGISGGGGSGIFAPTGSVQATTNNLEITGSLTVTSDLDAPNVYNATKIFVWYNGLT